MATCRDIRDLIGPFVEGDLSVAEGEQVHDHVESCASCAAIERDYRALSELLSPTPVDPANDEEPAWRRFDADLARRLASVERTRRGLYIPLPAAAVALFMLVGSAWVGLSAHQRADQLSEQLHVQQEALLKLQENTNALGLRTVSNDFRADPVSSPSRAFKSFSEMADRDPFEPPPEATQVNLAFEDLTSSDGAASTPEPETTPIRKRKAAIHFVDYEYSQGMY